MDGFCHEYDTPTWNGICPSYSYVPQSEAQPYFDIASYYGFANYMFQTNEGPSLPAHQFLFAGTSAPVPVTAPYSDATLIDSTGYEPSYAWCAENSNPGNPPWCAQPCYERAPSPYNWGSLADLLHSDNISWKYYAPSMNPNGSINDGLWVAPASITHFCGENDGDGKCDALLPGGTYYNNMGWEMTSNPVPVVTDIQNCKLAAVSWVIPDSRWSDHAGENNGTGPAYVANIVNTLGNNPACPTTNEVYWNDTAILITWDDWGGWYDHINPNATGGPGVRTGGAPWGNYYTYGFRVPLLVVSAYTGTPVSGGGYTGYVSGACGPGQKVTTCPNLNPPYVHDFGSILAFTEWNFLGKNAIGTIGQDNYPFADNYAPDWNPATGQVPLLDMFPLTAPRLFQPIPIPSAYPLSYFQNYFTNNPSAAPSGPDATDGDQ